MEVEKRIICAFYNLVTDKWMEEGAGCEAAEEQQISQSEQMWTNGPLIGKYN